MIIHNKIRMILLLIIIKIRMTNNNNEDTYNNICDDKNKKYDNDNSRQKIFIWMMSENIELYMSLLWIIFSSHYYFDMLPLYLITICSRLGMDLQSYWSKWGQWSTTTLLFVIDIAGSYLLNPDFMLFQGFSVELRSPTFLAPIPGGGGRER